MALYSKEKSMQNTITCAHCRLETTVEVVDDQVIEREGKLRDEIKRLKPFENDYAHISRQLDTNNKSLEHARQTIAVIKQLLALAEK